MSKKEMRRPLDPRTGAIILGGSMLLSLLATYVLARLLVWPQAVLEASTFLPRSSDGLWLYFGAAVIFPLFFGAAFLRLAKGVEPMRLVYTYAAGLYFVQCWAEFYVTEEITLWPQLAVTILATLVFRPLAERNAPPADEDESDRTPGQ